MFVKDLGGNNRKQVRDKNDDVICFLLCTFTILVFLLWGGGFGWARAAAVAVTALESVDIDIAAAVHIRALKFSADGRLVALGFQSEQ